MISAMQRSLVVNHCWLSQEEFSNGIAAGQITPGPLMCMVAFLGFKIYGFWGALLGTVALFLPSFIAVIVIAKNFEKIKENSIVKASLNGINACVVGLIASAAFDMAKSNLNSIVSVLIILGAGILILKFSNKDISWILLAAGLVGACFLR